MRKRTEVFWGRGLRLSRAILLLCLASVVLSGCGGGGGGGGGTGNSGQPVTVQGTVLRAETGAPPSIPVTISIGGVSVASNADGTFTLTNVPSNTTTASIQPATTDTHTQPHTFPVTLTSANGQSVNLGTIYVSDTGYNANVNGSVVLQSNGQGVSGATVTLGGATTKTASDGSFSLTNLPVNLGEATSENIGQVVAAGYATYTITSDTIGNPLVAGNNGPITIHLSPAVSGTTPGQPYTITGLVTVQKVVAPGLTVEINGTNGTAASTQTDSTGTYTFWVPAGKYTITAQNATGTTMQVLVTVQSAAVPVTAPPINFP